ncbi:MAG: Gfo/Idh/MocA family oxidoreductase [Alphaproteobacteria bacterium]|uniref:Gfo/Idh/MocA family oxidoreductase n=1 Tax=Candidatus Nitrobium versatile TaxID=2884831 RepID=A0A953M1E4_9BACT|nr:Gfo/Idh/MocA family oxidoreductase [Candidatus Nitrobium versatile]
MRVIVVGYGSIGKRHVCSLLKFNNIAKISIFTGIKEEIPLDGRIQLIDSSLYSLDDILEHERFDFAIVANETYKHIDTAITLAEKGIPLFIEKPLSNNLDRVETLREIIDAKKLKVFIAYNLRFLGAIRKAKQELKKGAIGQPYFAKIEVGQYLPDWRPNSDYRKLYSADGLRGGGAGLDLSHEVDYMYHLFGMPSSWKVFKAKVSALEINSEDIFEGMYQFENGFLCNVHMDYLQRIKKRTLRIIGSNGTITLDIAGKYMEIVNGREIQYLTDETFFDTGRTYIDELRHFIDAVKSDTPPLISLNDGISVLKLLEDKNV